jgi:hypothetical protein
MGFPLPTPVPSPATALSGKEYSPVNFYDWDNDCQCYDGRDIECQKVQQDDNIAFQLNGAVGSDVVTYGDFDTSTDAYTYWARNTAGNSVSGWTWSSLDEMQHQVGMTHWLCRNDVLEVGELYEVHITVNRVTSQVQDIIGQVRVYMGNFGAQITKSGTYVQYIRASIDDLCIIPSITFDGAVTNIYVYKVKTNVAAYLRDKNTLLPVGDAQINTASTQELLDINYNFNWADFNAADGCYNICIYDAGIYTLGEMVGDSEFDTGTGWTLGANWSIAGGKLSHTVGVADSAYFTLSGGSALQVGKKYTVEVQVTAKGGTGNIQVWLGTDQIGTITAVGSYLYEHTVTGGNAVTFTSSSTNMSCDIEYCRVSLHIDSYECSLISQCYDLKETHSCTSLLKWTNYDNAFGFDYETYPTFAHYLRLPLIKHSPSYPTEDQNFTDSEGESYKIYGKLYKKWKMSCPDQHEYIHDAIAVGKVHDYFAIDGVEYVCVEGGYEPFQEFRTHADVNFDIVKKTEILLNRNC